MPVTRGKGLAILRTKILFQCIKMNITSWTIVVIYYSITYANT